MYLEQLMLAPLHLMQTANVFLIWSMIVGTIYGMIKLLDWFWDNLGK